MKEPEIDLLWRLGIEPRLTGYQYYLDAFEKIKAGMKIDPLLLRKIAAEHNTDYRNIYNAMRTAQQFSQRKKAIIYEEFMGQRCGSLYEFLYQIMRETAPQKYMKTKGSKQMYPIQIVRKVDELGRIVLPLEFRRKMSVDPGDSIIMVLSEDGQAMLMKKYKPSCICCQQTQDLRTLPNGVYVCKRCLSELQ